MTIADIGHMRSAVLRKCRRLVRLTAFFGCVIFVLPVVAQRMDDQDPTSLSIEELTHTKVFSASRHLEDSRQAPSSVSVITAEDIKQYGWRTLGEALDSLRGFYSSYDRDYTRLGVRGYLRPGDYNSRVLVLINGHRLNDNVFDSALLGTEFPLDLDLVDHIEIVRGPSSSLFGTNAVFGVINVITRHSLPPQSLELSGDIASLLGRTGRLTASFQRGKLTELFSGSLYRSAGHARLFFPEFDAPQTNGGWAENVDADRSNQVFADVQYGNFSVHGLYAKRVKVIPTAPFQTRFNDSSNRSSDGRGFVDLSYHRSVPLGDLEIHAYYDRYNSLGSGAFCASDTSNCFSARTSGDADWMGTAATLDKQLGQSRIVVGADYEYSFRVDQKNVIVGLPALFTDHRQPSRAAMYGEAELNLVPKLSVRVGGRLDWFDIYGESLSPRFAFVYSPNSRNALKYVYGQAFRAPNAYENYYFDGVVQEAPAKSLQPETMASHELIFERGLSSWSQVTVDGSYNHLQGLIDDVSDPATGLSRFVNIGENTGRSLEAEFAAKRTSGLAARASYTLADSADNRGHRLANSPLHLAKINGTVPFSRYTFGGLELLYSSAQETYQSTRVRPSTLSNVTLSSKPIFGGWTFSASCYNALNHRWYSPAGPELRQAQIQQDGRTYLFKLTRTLQVEKAKK